MLDMTTAPRPGLERAAPTGHGSASSNFGAYRLCLAGLVLWMHYEKLLFGHPTGSWIEPFEIGSLAVLAFFVLSGYVIVAAAHTFYPGRPRAFLVNRAFRIFPIYLAVMALSLAVVWPLAARGLLTDINGVASKADPATLHNILANIVWLLPFGNKLVSPDFTLVPIAWAVRTELIFYLAVGACLFLARIIGGRFSTVGAVAGALALIAGALEIHGGHLNFPTFRVAPHFVFGGAVFYVVARRSPVALLMALASAALMISEILLRSPFHEAFGFARNLWGEAALFAALVGVFLALIRHNPVPASLDSRLGDYSYPLYLGHVVPLFAALSLGALAAPSALWLVGTILASALLTVLLVHVIERPLQGIRARIRGVSVREGVLRSYNVPTVE